MTFSRSFHSFNYFVQSSLEAWISFTILAELRSRRRVVSLAVSLNLGEFLFAQHKYYDWLSVELKLEGFIFLEKTSITFNELVKFLEHVVAGQTANYEIQSVFNVFDHNQIGHVPVSELTEALESFYGSTLSADVLQEILLLADLDKDGNVNKEGR